MFNFYNIDKEMLENDFEFHDFLGPGNTVCGLFGINGQNVEWTVIISEIQNHFRKNLRTLVPS